MNKKNIINFDLQGWPITQLNIRDIIEKICTYDTENNRYYIDANSDVLDLVPRVFEDDGMGYGVNEKRVISFDVFGNDDDKYSNIFIEEKVKDVELWVDAKFFPNCFVKKGRKRYITRNIRKKDDGTFEYECEGYISKFSFNGKYEWIEEDKLKFD